MLGCDFMTEFNVSINVGNRSVIFQNGEEVSFVSESKGCNIKVCNVFDAYSLS